MGSPYIWTELTCIFKSDNPESVCVHRGHLYVTWCVVACFWSWTLVEKVLEHREHEFDCKFFVLLALSSLHSLYSWHDWADSRRFASGGIEVPKRLLQSSNTETRLLLDVDGWHVLSSSYCPVGPLESTRWRFNPSAYLSFRRWKSCRHDEGWVIDLLLQFPLMASMKQLWRLPSLKHSHNYIGHTSRRCPSRFHRYIHCRTHIVLLFKQMAQSSRQERSKWQWNNIKNTAVLVSRCCKYAPKTLEFQRWP